MIEMGKTVRCGKADDEERQSFWTRVENLNEDARKEETNETTFHSLRIDDKTTGLDIIFVLMPLKPEERSVTDIRDGADNKANCKLTWNTDKAKQLHTHLELRPYESGVVMHY